MKALLRISLRCAVLSIPLLLQPLSALADATEPVADIPGARDPAPLKRYEGAFIVSFEQREYARLSIPLSALKPSVDSSEYDSHNNRVHRPENSETLEGKVTRVVYVLPAQRSPLEVVRNYEDEIAALDGETRFECLREACGGDAHRATAGGGGKTSLMMQFLHESNVKDAAFSNGNCALTSRIDDQHYIAATWPKGNQHRLRVQLRILSAMHGFVQDHARRRLRGHVWRDQELQAGLGVVEALDGAVAGILHVQNLNVGVIEDDVVEAAARPVTARTVEVLDAADADGVEVFRGSFVAHLDLKVAIRLPTGVFVCELPLLDLRNPVRAVILKHVKEVVDFWGQRIRSCQSPPRLPQKA